MLRGVGSILAFLFLNQAAIASVAVRDAPDAAGLFSAMRNLGGSFALAGIGVIQDQRLWLHNRRIEETLNANSPDVQSYVDGLTQSMGSVDAAMLTISSSIQRDALVMTYNDIFWMLGWGIIMIVPLVLFLRPLPKGPLAAMH